MTCSTPLKGGGREGDLVARFFVAEVRSISNTPSVKSAVQLKTKLVLFFSWPREDFPQAAPKKCF